ncbi:MAG: hypothetical protein GXO97_03060 [Nitrospirae bacterium]|nr:hypothetical protein [Nitrospirota bacterium]
MRSIRRYLTLRLLFGLLILVLGSNALLYLYVYKKTVSQFDMSLQSSARDLASMAEQDSEGISVEWRREFHPEFTGHSEPEYFQIWSEDGRIIARSPSLKKHDLPRKTGSINSPLFWNLTLPDGRPGRAIGISFFPHIDKEDSPFVRNPARLELVLARSTTGITTILRIFLFGSLFITVILCVGIVTMVPRIIVSGLSPLKDLSQYTSSIDEYRLGTRYPTDNLPDELVPIVTRLNELLQRIENAFTREKRLTSDIAHELKTPIAELRSLSEVAMRWPDDSEFVSCALKNTVEIAHQMDRIVSQLLTLNRCEKDKQEIHPTSIDLVSLIRELWLHWERVAEEKSLKVEFSLADEVIIFTDRTMLSSIISNLFSNAVEYSPEGGDFRCVVKDEAGSIILSMQNSNETLTEDDLPHIFEYLWRKDTARSNSLHTGLGLTLVKAFASYLGIEVRTEFLDSGDFCISLIMPVKLPDQRAGHSGSLRKSS